MTYPSHLGGSHKAAPHSATNGARAVVRDVYQDEQTKKWYIQVRLRGGKMLNRIMPLRPADAATSASSPPLPGRGATGIIMFEEFEQGIDGYWLGAIDVTPHGVDRDTAGEDLHVYGSGFAEAVTEDGTHTTRWPNGDIMFAGAGAPYVFKLRAPDFVKSRKLLDLVDLPVKNNYVLDARKGGALWSVMIFGDLKLTLDAAKRQFEVNLSDETKLTLKDGVMTVDARIMQVGKNPDYTVPAALWPETETTLVALAHELRAVKRKLIMTEARVTRNQMVFELLLTTFFPYFLPLLKIPPIPIPFITKSDKSGGIIPNIGGVQVIDAASTSIYGE